MHISWGSPSIFYKFIVLVISYNFDANTYVVIKHQNGGDWKCISHVIMFCVFDYNLSMISCCAIWCLEHFLKCTCGEWPPKRKKRPKFQCCRKFQARVSGLPGPDSPDSGFSCQVTKYGEPLLPVRRNTRECPHSPARPASPAWVKHPGLIEGEREVSAGDHDG